MECIALLQTVSSIPATTTPYNHKILQGLCNITLTYPSFSTAYDVTYDILHHKPIA